LRFRDFMLTALPERNAESYARTQLGPEPSSLPSRVLMKAVRLPLPRKRSATFVRPTETMMAAIPILGRERERSSAYHLDGPPDDTRRTRPFRSHNGYECDLSR